MEDRKTEIQGLGTKIKDGIIDAVVADEEEMILEDLKKRMTISLVFVIPLICVGILTPMEHWSILWQIIFVLPVIAVDLRCFSDGITAFWRGKPQKNTLSAIGSIIALAFLQFTAAGVMLTMMAICRYFECYINCKCDAHLKELIAAEPQGGRYKPGDLLRIPEVAIAGFDGFKDEYRESYSDAKLPSLNTTGDWVGLNREIREMFQDFRSQTAHSMKIEFVTKSYFE